MKRSRPTPLAKYTALCDLVDTHKGRIELWTGTHELQTLRVVSNRRAHCTPIIEHDIEEAAGRMLNKHIFR